MSIKNEVFKICKYIFSIDCRASIAATVKGLSTCNPDDSLPSKDFYHQFARSKDAQFLGFLLCEKSRDSIHEQLNISLPPLTEDEKKNLTIGYSILNNINTKCSEPFHIINHQLAYLLNPYSNYIVDGYYKNVDDLFDVTICDGLIAELQNSKIFSLLSEFKHADMTQISKSKFLSLAESINHQILSSGVHSVPSEIDKLLMNRQEPIYSTIKYLLATICIREVMKAILELTYQAFLSNKLIVLNNDNITSIDKCTGGLCGKGMTVTIQPNRDEIFLEHGNILLFAPKIRGQQDSSLYRVEELTLKFDNEWGTSQILKLRMLDDDLNPYSSFLN
ncbi:hypothetical protein [Clostridium sp. KNHs216]|uniref:hypothetical protein n=1 Tax=Clostridium sp. KNHs216 TaxID=1550235 RepID=UPI001154222D|nr:hypothetical protein [Clostridium sp. KNHs216]TQI66712.1 hypothetical protein LY85_1383 [Clostridium sp. KNHs216]